MQDKIIFWLQVLAGILLIFFGLNGFLHFYQLPHYPLQMSAWLMAIAKTGYLFPLISAVELLAGLAFVSNKFAALMAVVLLPVMLNALLAHIFLHDTKDMGPALFVVIVILLVIYKNKSKYSQLFKA